MTYFGSSLARMPIEHEPNRELICNLIWNVNKAGKYLHNLGESERREGRLPREHFRTDSILALNTGSATLSPSFMCNITTIFIIVIIIINSSLKSYCRVLQNIREYCRVLQSTTEYYRVLQSIAEYCRVLQSIAEYCRVLQSISEYRIVLQSIAEYCRVLQSTTEYFRVLQSIADCRVLQGIRGY